MKNFKKFLPVLGVLLGFALLLYPWISEHLYNNRNNSLIETYEAEVQKIESSEKQDALEKARAYNENLLQSVVTLSDPFTSTMESEDFDNYNSILSFDDMGLMGTIEIPAIKVDLPIYHGTSEEVLKRGVGHLEYSSFPIGGENTHAVLSGHTGLNSAKLFTDLTELQKDDLFFLNIMGDKLAYKVCDINIVEPSDSSLLQIQRGKDLVTLITCTPYGVNSHRLLVTGERTDYVEEAYQNEIGKSAATDSQWMKQYRNAILIGILVSIGLFTLIFVISRWKRRKSS